MRSPANMTESDLGRVADRVGERLGRLSSTRLTETEARLRDLVEELAALALEAEGREQRDLPWVSARGLGDQVVVLGRDLAAALEHAPSPDLLDRGRIVLTSIRRAVP